MTIKGRLCLAAPLLVFLVLGCGGGNPNAPAFLSGKITYEGSPVTAGKVTFYTTAGVYSRPINADGTYTAANLPAGETAVEIETESANKERSAKNVYGGGKKGQSSPIPEGAPAAEGEYVKIPAKYANKTTSGLSVTLNAGKQEKDFVLTK